LHPVTFRSVAIGLCGVVLICAITPFNNYVANNTDIIGSALPTGVVVALLLATVVNGVLSRVLPRAALSVGEMALALSMVLVACALPAVGLMRYLPGHLVQFHAIPAENSAFARVVEEMGLPDWLWPRVAGDSPVSRAADPVVRDYVGRIAGSVDETLWKQVTAVPWSAWVKPALAWGTFFAMLFGAVLFLTLIFRRQWVDNERLPFPLASVFMSLIEPPAPGRAFNRLLSSRAFWIMFGAVCVIHGLGGLSKYDPQHFPELPMSFNLTGVLSERPWSLTDSAFRAQTIYFTIIGMVYFADTRVALSAWVFFIGLQIVRMTMGTSGRELTGGMQLDQGMGAAMAFAVAILWIARRHLGEVVAQMFRGRRRATESHGRYLPHAVSGWGFTICATGMIVWLTLVGASMAGAVLIVTLLMLIYLVLAKVVAETGLLYVLVEFEFRRPWLMLAQDAPMALRTRTTLGTYFYSSMLGGMLTHDERQSMAVYAPQALRINDLADDDERPRSRWPVVACLMLAIAVAFVTSGAGMLWADYTFATPLDGSGEKVVSSHGSYDMPRWISLEPLVEYVPPLDGPHVGHNRLGHAGFGAGVVGVLSAMRLRYVGWPLHPVGFLLVYTWGLQQIWFSLFLGWLAKSLLIRLGGAKLFMRARPVFLGLIVGEASAAGFWLVVSLVRLALGLPYVQIRLLPS
jgi:hypothetical protein